ncbi:MAG: SURF1 family protein [Alphaproteobacteria bacterium]|nr:SURF1 family protein [Alphaproteobacteria bacterium]
MTSAGGPVGARRPRSTGTLVALVGLSALLTATLVSLGVWQIERRAWKLDLIARVEQRVRAAPVSPPGPEAWSRVTAARDGYRRVRMTGLLDLDHETFVQALTEQGPGFWVMAPLRTDQGFTVLVNRGFVPAERRDRASRPLDRAPGPVRVVGLLRISEPGGGFLRANDPAGGRWYSRDVRGMATANGLSDVAPYFVDADAAANPGGWPRGGLTVIRFANSHLVYAFTWFGLALMMAGAGAYLVIDQRHARRAVLEA